MDALVPALERALQFARIVHCCVAPCPAMWAVVASGWSTVHLELNARECSAVARVSMRGGSKARCGASGDMEGSTWTPAFAVAMTVAPDSCVTTALQHCELPPSGRAALEQLVSSAAAAVGADVLTLVAACCGAAMSHGRHARHDAMEEDAAM